MRFLIYRVNFSNPNIQLTPLLVVIHMFLCLGRLLFRGLIPICVVLRPSRFLWFARCLANRNEVMKNGFLVIKRPSYDVELIVDVLDLIEDSTAWV